MKFVVDGMLGGLARWLRILGYETDYDSKTDDTALLRIASDKSMILLTRDEELHKRALAKNMPSLLVLGDNEEVRLGQLARRLDICLSIEMSRTRCPECGSKLHEVSKDEVSRVVPSASFKMYDRYWKCENTACGKVYWEGSHWKQIHHTLEEARKIASLQS